MNKIDLRQTSNKQILHLLEYYVEKYPQLRFGQLLMNTIYPDLENNKIWNEESIDILKRIENSIK